MKRARREQKRLKTHLGRVMRDIERHLARRPDPHARLAELLGIAHRIHAQQRHDKHKLYSVHAPEVECIAKGKAHKRYEFGVKVSTPPPTATTSWSACKRRRAIPTMGIRWSAPSSKSPP